MELEKLLKQLRNIDPDPAYSARSRSALLASLRFRDAEPRRPFWATIGSIFITKPALAAEGIALLVVVSLGLVYLHQQSTDKLVVQATNVNSSIQVKLDEIKYLLNKKQPLFSPQKTKELTGFLNTAQSSLDQANADLNTADLENSLNKLKAAEEFFAQFEAAANRK